MVFGGGLSSIWLLRDEGDTQAEVDVGINMTVEWKAGNEGTQHGRWGCSGGSDTCFRCGYFSYVTFLGSCYIGFFTLRTKSLHKMKTTELLGMVVTYY